MKMKIELDMADLEAVVMRHAHKVLREEIGVPESELAKVEMTVKFNVWQNHDEAGFDGVTVFVKK